MFGSTVLEVAAGVVFCYFAVSLIVSSINESISSFFNLRAKTLLNGVKHLLNDPNFTGVVRELYNHAMISPLLMQRANTEQDMKKLPAYIPSNQFAQALLEVVMQSAAAPAAGQTPSQSLKAAIDGIPDPQLKQLLQGMYVRANGRVEDIEKALADWFDHGMDRVSGWYKRQTQALIFIIALLVSITLNVDSLHLFKTLWTHSGDLAKATAGIAAASNASAVANQAPAVKDAIAGLNALPIGWTAETWDQLQQTTPLLLMFAGWFLTACSSLFGAPFWFDLLQKITNLRGAGPKPQTQAQTDQAAN
ncbi:hypothetical protein [Andreprevotia chitinilytica]|uniref:hypothetical protein n=1 Tax=Andreprevotia chitinilytica TaxID=396808 RepID=UPI000691C668|nr:hypothetical protein [Andreprevotia chitinilytica]